MKVARPSRPDRIQVVFVASTSRDLAEFRAAVAETIGRLDGYKFVGMETFGSRDVSAEEFDEEVVRECDVFIGIIGHVYGSTPKGSSRSFTELEYDAAVKYDKPRLMFVAPDGLPAGADIRESEEKVIAQAAFRERIRSGRIVADFSSPQVLAVRVSEAIHNQLTQAKKGLAGSELFFEYRGWLLNSDELDFDPLMGTENAEPIDLSVGTWPDDPQPQQIGHDQEEVSYADWRGLAFGRPVRKASRPLSQSAIALRSSPGLHLVRGDGGSGKTTMLKVMVRRALDEDRFPILVRLRDWASTGGEHALRFWASRTADGMWEASAQGPSLADALFEEAQSSIASGRAVLLLDGLDEVPPRARSAIHRGIKRLLHRALDDRSCPIIVTSRFGTASEVIERWKWPVSAWEMIPLEAKQIEEFLARHLGWDAAREVSSDLRAHHEMRIMMGNPLFLQLCAYAYVGNGSALPKQLCGLFERAVERMLDTENPPTNKPDPYVEYRALPVGVETLTKVVEVLALEAFLRDTSRGGDHHSWTADKAIRVIRRVLSRITEDSAEPRCRAVLGDLERRRLFCRVGSGYIFLHGHLQEYFVGRRLAKMSREETRREDEHSWEGFVDRLAWQVADRWL